jgi:S-ribosylhomocysteine lyase
MPTAGDVFEGALHPMGCGTGFYLLVRNESNERVLEVLKDCLKKTVEHDGEIFGGTRKECGNYKALSLDSAKKECAAYLEVLNAREHTFEY